ncbi:MAG: hypothetical protein ACPGXI_10985 [Mycobacterium sp.]
MSEPRTLAEHLDAATNGAQFSTVLQGLFGELERLRDLEQVDEA